MKLQDQVTSLEISKRLKELGVKQESLFYLAHEGKIRSYDSLYQAYLDDYHDKDMPFHGKFAAWLKEVNGSEVYSAFTVAELGNFFSKEGEIEMPKFNARLQKWERELVKGRWISCDTEADARGRLRIYLIENNLVESKI